jgi:peptidoglycan/xylan/chitin deacetylase (PgdA/CDA1 family)
MAFTFITVRHCFKISISLALLALLPGPLVYASDVKSCAAKIFLTFDTGSMSQAQLVADVLKRQQVKASFFLANEKTTRGDYALDPSWQAYWSARASEGHAFGSHTFDHVYFKGPSSRDNLSAKPQFGASAGQQIRLSNSQLCRELDRVKTRFKSLTGNELDPIWRAPGGKAPEAVMQAAQSCGYKHFYWAEAGFSGDELPSETYPNKMLLERALTGLKSGDIVMAHLGIWSRRDPWAPAVLEPLIAGLKAKGFCFATLRDHPAYKLSP